LSTAKDEVAVIVADAALVIAGADRAGVFLGDGPEGGLRPSPFVLDH
jgi:hypothetical protein